MVKERYIYTVENNCNSGGETMEGFYAPYSQPLIPFDMCIDD